MLFRSLNTAIKTSELLFGNGSIEFLHNLPDSGVREVFDGIPFYELPKSTFDGEVSLTELLAEKTQIFTSKGEAKKMIKNGGLMINKEKVSDENAVVGTGDFIKGKFLVVQKGKKNYFLIQLS